MGFKKTIASLVFIGASNLALVGCNTLFPDNQEIESLYFQQHRLIMKQYEEDLRSIKRGQPTSDEIGPMPRTDAEYLYGTGSNLRSLERQEHDRWKY